MREHLLISDKHIFLSNFTIPLNDCALNVVLTLRQGLGFETQGRVYRYKCRLYQPGSPSDKSDSLTGRGCCTGVGPFLWWLPVMQHSLSLHRIQPPIAMKLSAEQYKLCALLVRAARQCAAHFAAGACLCTASHICNTCTSCTACNTCTACTACALLALIAIFALFVHSTGFCL